MEKLKRILAILAIISLVFCALLTLVLALLTNFGVGDFTNAWRASALSMIILPVLFYVMIWICKLLKKQ